MIETKVHGLNRKVSNLVNMAPCIRHDVVVLADSDMRVDPDYLSRVIAALEEPGVGAVTCLYYGVPVAGPWSSLAALAINAHFLPGVVVGLAVGLARPCFGSTLALRRRTLSEIGGFIAFVDCLADDYAMGKALRARGLHDCDTALRHRPYVHQTSAREFWRHELRWARTIKSIDPRRLRRFDRRPSAAVGADRRRCWARARPRLLPALAIAAGGHRVPDGAAAAGGAGPTPFLRKRIGLCPRVTYCRSFSSL